MLEVMRLMPSFGKKLNPDGFSPLHLALQSPDDRTPTIRQLIRANRDVIRVKGRMGMTALHWVAQSGDINLLLEFLKACPESIEDLTDKFETALHVAVKNRMVDAVKILIVKALSTPPCRKNLRNLEGKTALDVLNEKQGQMNPHIAGEIRKVLRNPIGPWLDKLGWFYHLEIMTEDARKALLVVAVLIATATYQALLEDVIDTKLEP
ncbi:Ankyrin repeat, partial [Dillenia turbinata]